MNKIIQIILFSPCLLLSFLSYSIELKTKDFTVIYDTNVPIKAVEALVVEVKNSIKIVKFYLTQSKKYNGTPITERLIVYISKTHKTPYQDWNTIHIPEDRVLNAFAKGDKRDSKGLAVIHELTHVYAVSAFRKNKINGYENRFFDDGLAVFLQHRFGKLPEYPNFGMDLYASVATKSQKYGKLLSLKQAEHIRHSSKTGLGRQLAYLQEGAFTQFLIENYGLDKYFKIYQGHPIKSVTGKSFAELEVKWSKMINAFRT